MHGGGNRELASGEQDRTLAAIGIGSAVGSLLLMPPWAALITIAAVVAALAWWSPARRRALAVVSALLLITGVGFAVWSERAAGRTDAEKRAAAAAEGEQSRKQLERLETRINALLEERRASRAERQARALEDQIPVEDLRPIRSVVVEYINRVRDREGVPRVERSADLERTAQRHAAEMARDGDFFSHASRDGTSAAERIRGTRLGTSGGWRTVGENIAFVGAGEGNKWLRVMSLWQSSASHRAVLRSEGMTHVGIGIADGEVGGSKGSVYVADFGGR